MSLVVNLTLDLKKRLLMQRVNYLKSKMVRELYKEHEYMLIGPAVASRHTACADYKGLQGSGRNYGVEIEVGLKHCDYFGFEDVKECIASGVRLALVRAGWGFGFSVQDDNSVPLGFEIVLAPAPIDKIKRTLRRVYGRHGLRELGDFGKHTGLHVTVDPLPTDKATLLFYRFFNDPWIAETLRPVIGRPSNKYCERSHISSISDLAKLPRESAVRPRENGSHEVRVFASTGDMGRTDLQLEMVDKVYKLACAEEPWYRFEQYVHQCGLLFNKAYEKNNQPK